MMKIKRRPNVFFILTDQQRWDTTGIHGNPLDLTPNFDWMAQEGTHLYHTFTPQPVCGPARACIQTGMYATQVGCITNGVPLPGDVNTLARCFGSVGYRTGYIGKWHLAEATITGAVPPEQRGGYDYWLAANVLEFTSEPYHTVMFDNTGNEVSMPGYRVDALTDAAIRYIDQHQKDPFFLFLSYLEPHFQNRTDDYPAPEGYAMRYAGRWIPPDLAALGGSVHYHLGGYYGMVRRLDEALGRILDALRSLDLMEDTIIVFTSDHGNHFKTRNSEYKRSCHDASIRVPTALYGAGFTSGGRIRRLVSLLDLPPTLLAAAGLTIPEQMVGRSILPLLRGEAESWQDEIFIQISESQVGRALRTRRWKYSVGAPGKDGNRDPGSDYYIEEFLYDMVADPYEMTNLTGLESHRTVAQVLRQRLIQRIIEAGEEKPVIEPAPARPSGQRLVRLDEIGE